MAQKTPNIQPPNPQFKIPLYKQVAREIEQQFNEGRLRIGERLPSERQLARNLGISRTTATNAYQELEARGLIHGHVGRGTILTGGDTEVGEGGIPWVLRESHLAGQVNDPGFGMRFPRPDAISFADGWPDPMLYPIEILNSLANKTISNQESDIYTPSPPEGELSLKQALADWLAQYGHSNKPEEILITSGAQAGINVVIRAFIAPGDVVITESPTWTGANLAFSWAGAYVIGIPLDQQGIHSDLLEEAFIRYRPKLLYLMPNFQHPSGLVLSRDRRFRILELATRYRVPILESDLYGQLHFGHPPPASLKALDGKGVVIYQGSFSKMVTPGLRIGWLIAPPGAMRALVSAKVISDIFTPKLPQLLVAEFLKKDILEPHLVNIRKGCLLRRDTMVGELQKYFPDLNVRVPSGGFYLWVKLPHGVSAIALASASSEQGVLIRSGGPFMPQGNGDNHIRLCFASQPPSTIIEGVHRLAVTLENAVNEIHKGINSSYVSLA